MEEKNEFISLHTVQPYNYKLIIATPRSKKEIKELEETWGLRNENDQLCGVYNIEHNNWKTIFVIFNFNHKQTITYGMVSHEALHVIDTIFEKIGHSYTYDNNEPGTYLIEWVVNTIMTHINDCKLLSELTFETIVKPEKQKLVH